MRQETKSKDCSLAGSSDLTVIAPLRKGFVPGLDAVTYKTRAQRVLRALHTGRSGLHEFELARMLSDAVERVGRIHSVRIAVLDEQDAVLLAVTFDGAWESYVRVIWQKVARLLDLIFCNTEGYVNGWDASFEDWGRWLRWRQAETSFLYALPALSVDDTVYLRMHERLARAKGASELETTRLAAPVAEAIAEKLLMEGLDPTTLPEGLRLHAMTEAQPAVFRQGMRSLAGLYRLADLYPPTHGDGLLLLRAAQELLPEFTRVTTGRNPLREAWRRAQERFKEPLDWFIQELPTPASRQASVPEDAPKLPDYVQGGILQAYGDIDQGVVLLVRCDSPAAVQALVKAAPVTLQMDQGALKPGELTCNLAFTVEGLRTAGLSEEEIQSFPTEFVQGMERRASVLGDLRINHPRRWRLPLDNWAAGTAAADASDTAAGERVQLQFVHAVVQLRRIRVPAAEPAEVARESLLKSLQTILGKAPGVRPLSLQWLHRLHANGGTGQEVVDHFGFQDSASDPVFHGKDAGGVFGNHVHLGEALVGHPNAGDAAAPRWPDASPWTRKLVQDGSFLVVRKLRTDLAVLEEVLAEVGKATRLDRDLVLGKMMGRWPHGSAQAGEPLVDRPGGPLNANDFGFEDDAQGSQCPLHAHIRRANPREASPATGSRPPRLFRRGLSYGPAFDPDEPDPDKRRASLHAERGLFFMAYNASLGEQFEVVQRWLSGGNSTGGYSGQGDPFLGVPEPGRPRSFRFEHAGETVRMTLDGSNDLLAEPRPLVRLEWGGYFLAPSFAGLQLLAERAQQAAARAVQEPLPWSVDRGARTIERLLAHERQQGADSAAREWKAALEDPEAAADFTTASVWAAIRERHGGMLRTPYGVLVASRTGVERVLRNDDRLLTSTGYLPRMIQSFGAIHLGMDPGQDDGRYETESAACNAAIRGLAADEAGYRQVFDAARAIVTAKLDHHVAQTRAHAEEDEKIRLRAQRVPRDRVAWELTMDVRELIDDLLATFCERWFGLAAGPLMERAGFRWTWKPGQPPKYPGHFMAPSRYIFQPHPEAEVEARGIEHGQAMREAMTAFLETPGAGQQAPVSSAVLAAFPQPSDRPLVARILVGAMMGMVPTVDANLRRVLDRWLTEGTLWHLRSQLGAAAAQPFREGVSEAFRRTMQSRVAPDTLWRTVQRGCPASADTPVALRPGDLIVAGLSSAAQQGMERGGPPDVAVAFGGTGAAPHPTHACPGYRPALAMMEGFAAALVGFGRPLQPGPGPLSFVVSGFDPAVPVPPAPPGPVPATLLVRNVSTFKHATFSREPHVVWTYGDSWLSDLWLPGRSSLAEELDKLGYNVIPDLSATGARLSEMAANVAQPARMLRRARPGAVHALVVGGGGNDVTDSNQPRRSALYGMLIEGATSAEAALDEAKVHQFVDEQCRGHYRKMLGELVGASAHLDIPIVVHGYANPIADGRAPVFGPFDVGDPWLGPVFELKGMRDAALNTAVMRILIGRLNTMIASVVADLAVDRLRYVDLRGHLNEQWSQDEAYFADWTDELHPTPRGFAVLAAKLAEKLPALVPALL